MKTLGTILPTRQTLALADKWHENELQIKRDTAKIHGLDKLEVRQEQGETRYYENDNRYAVASRRPGVVLWFNRGDDGYFYAEKWHK